MITDNRNHDELAQRIADQLAGDEAGDSGVLASEDEIVLIRRAISWLDARGMLGAPKPMPEPSASPDHEFVFGSVQSMRIRVWNETSRAVCIVDFDGVASPAGYISAFVAGLSPLGDRPEARRAEETKHEPDPVGSVKRYLDDGGKWD
jgi:hypothetical protein